MRSTCTLNGVHHAIVEVNIVIGVVLGEVLVARVVPLVVDAVIGLALGLIAHVVVVFRRSYIAQNFHVREIYSLHLPSVTVNCCWLFLEASQCRQCFIEISSMLYGHRVGTNKIRTDPPIVVCVILVRQFVHLKTYFFSATQFNHVPFGLFHHG